MAWRVHYQSAMNTTYAERLASTYAACGTEETTYADIDALVTELASLTCRQLDELGTVVCCSGLKSYARSKSAKLGYIERAMKHRLAARQRTSYIGASPFIS